MSRLQSFNIEQLGMPRAVSSQPASHALTFHCPHCGSKHVWSEEEQIWWQQTGRGYVYSTAVHCLSCQRGRRKALASI